MRRILLAGLAMAMLAGAGCSDGKLAAGGGGGSTGAGQLYVATPTAILRFSNALAATGNVAPSATVTGSATGLSSPQRILVDTGANRLFVANQGASSILIFESISTLNGNVAPTKTLSGTATLLSTPVDLALDATNNVLYVADGTRILVFQSASTITGNVPPVHNISMGFTVGGIFLDVANNRLFVADTAGNAIDRLEGANTQDGAAVVGGSISGAATALAHPSGVGLDSAGRLIVSNPATPSIAFFSAAATATGNVVPAATVTGANTKLANPGQIVFNSSVTNGELYVADTLAGAVFVFANETTATGNIAPTRTISGAFTGLSANAVNGVAIDPTR